MKEERRQYQEEIRQERGELDQLKAEKRALEADITKLRMNKEQLTRKLRWVQTHIYGERYLYKHKYMHWVISWEHIIFPVSDGEFLKVIDKE